MNHAAHKDEHGVVEGERSNEDTGFQREQLALPELEREGGQRLPL